MTRAPTPLAEYPYIHWEEVHFRDLDLLGHVNNVVYASWLESARIRYYMELVEVPLEQLGLIMAEMTITYKAPAYFNDRIAVGVRVSSIGTKSFVMEYLLVRESDETLIASSSSILVCYDYQSGKTVPVPAKLRQKVGL